MSDNDNATVPLVSALPTMLEEMGASADVERPEKKRSTPADNEYEAAKPQKKKHPSTKQNVSKILTANSKLIRRASTQSCPIPNGSKTLLHSI